MKELIGIVENSIDVLYEKGSFLFANKVYERTIAFKFAIYFLELINGSKFLELDLDFEYNRRGKELKKTSSRRFGSFPDLILHRRGTQEKNTLIIEFKCIWNRTSRNQDYIKHQEFTDQNLQNGYYYGLGIFFEFRKCIDYIVILFFQDGKYYDGVSN